MSQEHDPIMMTTTIRKQRRTRQRRNQPVLVAVAEANNSSLEADEQAVDTDNNGEQEAEMPTESESVPATKAQPFSRLPKFFSRVDKNEQKEEEVAKARLARAQHDKVDRDGTAATVEAKTKDDAKLQNKTKERREPLFKIRYFVGMTIYLFGAQLILPEESVLAHQLGIDHPFYTVTIFNNAIPLSSALVLDIATLILFLYILVKLDLLPNTASAKLRAEQKAREQQGKHRQNAAPAVKNVPSPVRLGVQGQDDDLYRAYRANQRREKKR
jgi:hypothetical protein